MTRVQRSVRSATAAHYPARCRATVPPGGAVIANAQPPSRQTRNRRREHALTSFATRIVRNLHCIRRGGGLHPSGARGTFLLARVLGPSDTDVPTSISTELEVLSRCRWFMAQG